MQEIRTVVWAKYRVRKLEEASGELVVESDGYYDTTDPLKRLVGGSSYKATVYADEPDASYYMLTVEHLDLSEKRRTSTLRINFNSVTDPLEAITNADPTAFKATLKALPSHDLIAHYVKQDGGWWQTSFYRHSRTRG